MPFFFIFMPFGPLLIGPQKKEKRNPLDFCVFCGDSRKGTRGNAVFEEKILDNNGLILYILYSLSSGCFSCLIP